MQLLSLLGSCFRAVFTQALSEMTNKNKLQAQAALVGLLGYVLVKYMPNSIPLPAEFQRCQFPK